MNLPRYIVPLVFTAILVGCSRAAYYPVEGVITLDGAPVAGASVTFVPSAGGRPGAAITDDSGRFVIWEAGMKQGLTQGNYEVSVFKVVWRPVKTMLVPEPGPSQENGPPRMMEQPVGEPEIERYIVPQRYIDPRTSGLRITVTGATKDLNLELTTKL